MLGRLQDAYEDMIANTATEQRPGMSFPRTTNGSPAWPWRRRPRHA